MRPFRSPLLNPERWLALFLAAPTLCQAAANVGIGELWVVDTSLPDTLQTQVIQTPAALTSSARLHYEIGFSTREQVNLGFLFDSITLALARADGLDSANLVTGDVFGLTIAPLSPNGLLSNGGITVHEIAPRMTLLPDAPFAFAYTVEVSLPPGLVGNELQSSFNFFNNGDDVPSRGYAILIPEPSPSALVGLACAIGVLGWRWTRRERA